MTTLHRNDIARLIANETGDTIASATKFVAAFEAITKFALQSGKTVDLRGFIKLEPTERAGRTGRNPQTGAAVEIPAKRIVKAKVSPAVIGDSEGGEI